MYQSLLSVQYVYAITPIHKRKHAVTFLIRHRRTCLTQSGERT